MRGYIENNLLNSEHVVYRTKLHWIIFLWPIVWLVVGMLFFYGGGCVAPEGVLFILIAVLAGISSYIDYKTSEFGITNKRVVAKAGFIQGESLEVTLNKVEGIQVKQGVLGRILGFGSITLSGAGGTKDPFRKIVAPLEFGKKVQEQMKAARGK